MQSFGEDGAEALLNVTYGGVSLIFADETATFETPVQLDVGIPSSLADGTPKELLFTATTSVANFNFLVDEIHIEACPPPPGFRHGEDFNSFTGITGGGTSSPSDTGTDYTTGSAPTSPKGFALDPFVSEDRRGLEFDSAETQVMHHSSDLPGYHERSHMTAFWFRFSDLSALASGARATGLIVRNAGAFELAYGLRAGKHHAGQAGLFIIVPVGEGSAADVGPFDLPANEWHRIVFQYTSASDASTPDAELRVYINPADGSAAPSITIDSGMFTFGSQFGDGPFGHFRFGRLPVLETNEITFNFDRVGVWDGFGTPGANDLQEAIDWLARGYDATDTDGDGFTDQVEERYSSNANDPGSIPPFGNVDEVGTTNMGDVLALYRALSDLTIDFEQGDGGLRFELVEGTTLWDLVPSANAHSPVNVAALSPISETTSDVRLATQPFQAAGEFRFWHTYELEDDAGGGGFDAGVLEISVLSRGGGWQDLGPMITEGGYTHDVVAGPLFGRRGWSAGTLGPMAKVVADLSSFEGEIVRVAFRFASDSSIASVGWEIDDISYGAPQPLPEDFESGPGDFAQLVAVGPECWLSEMDPNARSPSQSVHTDPLADTVSDVRLVTPQFTAGNSFSFWHTRDMEDNGVGTLGFDGGVLEISTSGPTGPWTDLGPMITQGGYTHPMSSNFLSPIGGQMAWSGGTVGPMEQVIVDLSSFSGQDVHVAFRWSTDESTSSAEGWFIDDVSFIGPGPSSHYDIDSDGDNDLFDAKQLWRWATGHPSTPVIPTR